MQGRVSVSARRCFLPCCRPSPVDSTRSSTLARNPLNQVEGQTLGTWANDELGTFDCQGLRSDQQSVWFYRLMADSSSIARDAEPFLQLGDQNTSGAEWSVAVNRQLWDSRLAQFPVPVELRTNAEGQISRTFLLELARLDRESPSVQAQMDLFWNVLAWGIAGSWRNVGRIVTGVANDIDGVSQALRTASKASFNGSPREAFRSLNGRLKHWGPAFFTKYLHFTTDVADHTKVQSLILDSRVGVAWRSFAGEWLDLTSSVDYERYCQVVCEIARGRGSTPSWVEGRFYQFGQRIGSYERFADSRLAICGDRLGTEQMPTPVDVWNRLG